MSSSSTARRRRAGRKMAISAAALVVCVLPTACNYAAASPSGGGADHSGHDGYGAPAGGSPTGPVVVPVGVISEATSAPSDDASPPAASNGPARRAPSTVAPPTSAAADESATSAQAPPSSGAGESTTTAPPDGATTAPPTTSGQVDPAAPPANNNGLDVLGTDCTASKLEPHNGFQEAPRCVNTSFGEVASEDQSPSLLITEAPETVAVGDTFTMSVSTRNLVRDRFLGAAAGGYYLESSFLNGSGLQRGHFHTACRMLDSTTVAPDSAPAPDFFLATQDNGGGADPDTVEITVTGMKTAGEAQCAVWAGDGSHRLPMMQRANQTPAFDAVRITVQ